MRRSYSEYTDFSNDERGAYTLKRADQLREQAPQADAAYRYNRSASSYYGCLLHSTRVRGRETTPHDVPIIAVAHAGRPGLLAGVIQRTVARRCGQGATQIHAWLGA